MSIQSKDGTPQRILIIRLSSIGDVVRTLPALASLRQQSPQAHIAWAIEDKSSGILEGHPHLNEVIVLERKRAVQSLKNPLGLFEGLRFFTRFSARIRRDRYDLVFDFHGIFKSGFIAALARSPIKVGFQKDYVKEFSHVFTNRKVRPSDARLPRVTRNLELISPFVSPENITDRAVLGVSDRNRDKARAFISQTFDNSHPLVAVHPGTSRELKKWLPHSFAEVCDTLIKSLNARVMLTWGPGEREEVEEIRSLAKTPPVVSMQTNSLLEFAALLEMCDLMITVDSGPMHIGSAVGTPIVAIFGPTDIRVNAPYWQPHKIVSSNLDCCPCNENCDFARCMEEVKPEMVFESAREMLTQTHAV